MYQDLLQHITTANSSLNVSGFTTLNNITTANSSLNVSGTTTLTVGSCWGAKYTAGP